VCGRVICAQVQPLDVARVGVSREGDVKAVPPPQGVLSVVTDKVCYLIQQRSAAARASPIALMSCRRHPVQVGKQHLDAEREQATAAPRPKDARDHLHACSTHNATVNAIANISPTHPSWQVSLVRPLEHLAAAYLGAYGGGWESSWGIARHVSTLHLRSVEFKGQQRLRCYPTLVHTWIPPGTDTLCPTCVFQTRPRRHIAGQTTRDCMAAITADPTHQYTTAHAALPRGPRGLTLHLTHATGIPGASRGAASPPAVLTSLLHARGPARTPRHPSSGR
jgi:hypothetical protein